MGKLRLPPNISHSGDDVGQVIVSATIGIQQSQYITLVRGKNTWPSICPPNEALLTSRQVLRDRWPLVVALADSLSASPSMTGEEVEALLSRWPGASTTRLASGSPPAAVTSRRFPLRPADPAG
jgi:hypothetical protein